MVPEMFEDYTGFRPWKEVAHILAEDDSWGPLYDLEQLARNEVKVSAVAYVQQVFELHTDANGKLTGRSQVL